MRCTPITQWRSILQYFDAPPQTPIFKRGVKKQILQKQPPLITYKPYLKNVLLLHFQKSYEVVLGLLFIHSVRKFVKIFKYRPLMVIKTALI